MAAIGGLSAWALPLRAHEDWVYFAILSLLVAWRRHAVLATARNAGRAWRRAVAAQPVAAAWAVLAVGIASTGCWLPTMQSDDIAYHLRLPWMLQQSGFYDMNPDLHVWALAPWLADVIQAFPQVMAHSEARGPVDALWLVLAACGLWRLARRFDRRNSIAPWLAVALFASIPLATSLVAGMQTEMPTAAILAWLLVIACAPATTNRRFAPGAQRCAAALFGALLAMKFGAAASAAILLPWALHRHRASLRWKDLASMAAIALAIGGSSYWYAARLSGNPFLPLFNGVFRSPYFAPNDFVDTHWTGHLAPSLPWRITFATGEYMDAYAGGFGFLLVCLAGAWLLALRERDLRTPMILCTAMLVAPLLPMQYARYAFPAMAVCIPLLCVAAHRVHPLHAGVLALLACLLNFAFQANGNWMLHGGAVRQTMRAHGRYAPLLSLYAPERVLAADMRARGRPAKNALQLDLEQGSIAELGARARYVNWYSRRLSLAAFAADADRSGRRWAQLLGAEGISDVVFRPSQLPVARRAGLALSKARLQARAGDMEWWMIPQATGDEP
ncbi:hypothetical protein GCM10025793_09710 [Lysobacter lycopersici]